MNDHCCSAMAYYCTNICPGHPDPYDCPDVLVIQAGDGTYGLPIRDGGRSYVKIDHCPWCGTILANATPKVLVQDVA